MVPRSLQSLVLSGSRGSFVEGLHSSEGVPRRFEGVLGGFEGWGWSRGVPGGGFGGFEGFEGSRGQGSGEGFVRRVRGSTGSRGSFQAFEGCSRGFEEVSRVFVLGFTISGFQHCGSAVQEQTGMRVFGLALTRLPGTLAEETDGPGPQTPR